MTIDQLLRQDWLVAIGSITLFGLLLVGLYHFKIRGELAAVARVRRNIQSLRSERESRGAYPYEWEPEVKDALLQGVTSGTLVADRVAQLHSLRSLGRLPSTTSASDDDVSSRFRFPIVLTRYLSGSLILIGLLGTLFGLSVAVLNIDSSVGSAQRAFDDAIISPRLDPSDRIRAIDRAVRDLFSSVGNTLQGMRMVFFASLGGVGGTIVFTLLSIPLLSMPLEKLTGELRELGEGELALLFSPPTEAAVLEGTTRQLEAIRRQFSKTTAEFLRLAERTSDDTKGLSEAALHLASELVGLRGDLQAEADARAEIRQSTVETANALRAIRSGLNLDSKFDELSRAVTHTNQAIGSTLSELIQGVRSTHAGLATELKALREEMSAGTSARQAVRQGIAEVAGALRAIPTGESLDARFAELVEAVNGVKVDVALAMAGATEAARAAQGAVERSQDAFANSITELARSLEVVFGRFQRDLERFTELMRRVPEDQSRSIAEMLKVFQVSAGVSMREFSERLERIQEATRASIEALLRSRGPLVAPTVPREAVGDPIDGDRFEQLLKALELMPGLVERSIRHSSEALERATRDWTIHSKELADAIRHTAEKIGDGSRGGRGLEGTSSLERDRGGLLRDSAQKGWLERLQRKAAKLWGRYEE